MRRKKGAEKTDLCQRFINLQGSAIMLLSMRAGTEGLNLQAATDVIIQ